MHRRLRRASLPQARIYQSLRTAHLERTQQATPATILYTERSYDFDATAVGELDLIRAGTLGASAVVLASRLATVEVNEPLVRQRLLRTLLAVLAAQLSGWVRRSPVDVVAHAIENRNPYPGTADRARLRPRLRAVLDQSMARMLARRIDRLSFGTPMAQDLYQVVLGAELSGASTVLIPELPAPCTCLPTAPPRARTVSFVGAFDERKGVRPLLTAWPLVAAADDQIRLRLMGKGPLTAEVVAQAGRLDRVEVVLDPSRPAIHAALSASRALVLLSQPRPRWREQVGLPIVEGLAHGCVIVTTEQTGLAPWLSDHGHTVVDSADGPADIAQAILDAVDTGPEPHEVLTALPSVDGRIAADRWLFEPGKGSR